MSKDVIVFSNPQNEGAAMYVRHFEAIKDGTVEKLGAVAFRFVGERQDRQFFVAIDSQDSTQDGVHLTALVETETAAEAVSAIHNDATLGWLLEVVDYEPAVPAANTAA